MYTQAWGAKMKKLFNAKAALLVLSGLLSAIPGVSSAAVNDDVAQTPLFISTSTVYPNIMFVLDDSGSMQWEAMPDGEVLSLAGFPQYYLFPYNQALYGGGWYNSDGRADLAGYEANNIYNIRARSSSNNTNYYDPDVNYEPWKRADNTSFPDASPSCAYHNPMNTGLGCRNLTVTNYGNSGSNTDSHAWWYRRLSNGSYSWTYNRYQNPQTGTNGFWPATYFNWTPGGAGCAVANVNNHLCYTRVEVRSGSVYVSPGGTTRSYSEEIQNFANWYTYYRSRILSSRSAIGKAFANQDDKMRVGFGAINKGSTSVDGQSTSVIIDGVRAFSGDDRDDFFESLYGRVIPTSGTPLRRALLAAGGYYSRSDNSGPWSDTPGVSGGDPHLECRSSYTILMTDGFWNGSSPGVGNSDNASGPVHTKPGGGTYQYVPADPYRDEWSNTLADVAMEYWKNDLRTDLDNKVPTNAQDNAFWQHMVTFAVGLGAEGSLDPEEVWQAVVDEDEVDWPEPSADNANNLDDMLHAGVNGHGGFFSAKDPQTFADELSGVLSNITSRQESATGLSSSSTLIQSDSLAFVVGFDSDDWSGELVAIEQVENAVTGEMESVQLWQASETIDDISHSARKIFTYDGSDGVAFDSTLDNTIKDVVQGDFDPLLVDVDDLIAYVRGDVSNEQKNGGDFRDRETLLGDIVNSGPSIVTRRNFGWQDLDGYDAYLDEKSTRPLMVYIGANDGMLHGFDENGVERFAYIPEAVLGKVHELAKPTYGHEFFVDGKITIGDAKLSNAASHISGWNTLAVGATGGGGKSIFALDVGVSGVGSLDAGNVLWEVNTDSGAEFEDDLGYTLGAPLIDRLSDGTWAVIFANGYDSNNKSAVLYVVNAETGALIRKLDTGVGDAADPNGLSTPAIVRDFDLVVDPVTLEEVRSPFAKHVYAGDLHGNMWKFDISGAPATWSVSYSGDPMFNAIDAFGERQPITAGPAVSRHPEGGYITFFGTGKFFSPGDQTVSPSNQLVDTFYAIWDKDTGTDSWIELSGVSDRTSKLQQQSLSTFQVIDANGVDREVIKSSENSVDWEDKDGWFVDLYRDGDRNGERVLTTPSVVLGDVSFSTYEPQTDPCEPGGKSRSYILRALSGKASLTLPDDYAYGGAAACPGGGGCAGIELGSGAPVSALLTIREVRDDNDQLVGYESVLNLPTIESGAATGAQQAVDEIVIGSPQFGRVYWYDPAER